MIRLIVLFIFVSAMSACKSRQTTPTTSRAEAPTNPTPVEKETQGPVSGEYTQIDGTILEILPASHPSEDHPCAKVPCQARIKINKVIMIDRFYDHSFEGGDEIGAFFMFSLNPTGPHNFPNLSVQYPGLSVGDNFVGKVEKGGSNSLSVEHYEVRK